MKAPKTSKDITQEWLEFIFTDYEKRTHPQAKVQLESYEMSDGCKMGEGYTSVIIKLDAKASILNKDINDDTSVPRENEYHVIIKFGSQDPYEKRMYDLWRLNQRELLTYTHVIDELNTFQSVKAGNEFSIDIPKFIYGQYSDKNYVLVMENMKANYYNINPKDKALNLEQSKAALSQLAQLHAISYAYNKANNMLEKFPCYNTNDQFRSIFFMANSTLFDIIIKYLKIKQDMKPLLTKVRNTKSFILNDCKEILKEPDGSSITCLNHGDCWNNNILIKDCANEKNNKDETYKISLIDWQLAHWGTPAYDLHYFTAGSTTPELRSEHLDDLLKHYHVRFTEVTHKLGTPVPHWDYEQLKREYDRIYAWGFMKKIGFSLLLSDASNDIVTGDKNGTLNPFLKIGKKLIAKILTPIFVKQFAVDATMMHLLEPTKKELITEKTQIFNDRFIKILLEAEKMAIFDKK